MCDAVEYVLDGEARVSFFGEPQALFPVRLRGGRIQFYRWGAVGAHYVADDNTPGWGAKFPETGWARLADIRSGTWERLEPTPVRILASRFVRIDQRQIPHWFALQPRQFIQGLLAQIGHHTRLYVVTVPPPETTLAHGRIGRGS
jgi:hypothetical protein